MPCLRTQYSAASGGLNPGVAGPPDSGLMTQYSAASGGSNPGVTGPPDSEANTLPRVSCQHAPRISNAFYYKGNRPLKYTKITSSCSLCT